MAISMEEKKKAAYALNLWTVSISQIVDYNDINILQQEYDAIMNNLNLESMPKDEPLLDIIKEIMDEITYIQLDEGDRRIIDLEYQHQVKNAVWNAVPNVGVIFASANPAMIAMTLATQIGTGYMNYRRNKAAYAVGYEKSKWQIARNRMQHLNGLKKQLFETAWRLADKYEFPDEFRLTEAQIKEYNAALMEPNPISRYISLDAMRDAFAAYPPFWYQIGSTANSVYRSQDLPDVVKSGYREHAMECFDKYDQFNRFHLLRCDLLTSSWALEYLELLGPDSENAQRAYDLIQIAEKQSGGSSDILELCAVEYLRLGDYDNASRLLRNLVNKHYNGVINTQILSSLYIKGMANPDPKLSGQAHLGYMELAEIAKPEYDKYILAIPPAGTDLAVWEPVWNKEEDPNDLLRHQKTEEDAKEAVLRRARSFYEKPTLLVYEPDLEKEAEYLLGVMDDIILQLGRDLPSTSKCTLRSYRQRREEIESMGTRVILLGNSDEAKKLYQNTPRSLHLYGMNVASHGNKIAIWVRPLKKQEFDAFIEYARPICEALSVRLPRKTSADAGLDTPDAVHHEASDTGASNVVETALKSARALLNNVAQGVSSGVQSIAKAGASKDNVRFLQYCVAFYKYLESENGITG